ncbi:MAG: hypothetical protein EHM91_02125, partial [Planctomycetota bacterium]
MVSAAVLDILGNLKAAVAQSRLHPKDSPQVVKTGSDTFESLKAYLDAHPTLVLSTTHSGLTVNGQQLAAAGLEGSLIPVFTAAGVRSIVFRRGATQEELLTFIDAFVRKFWDLKDGRQINQRLLSERVASIDIDKLEDGSDTNGEKAGGLLSLEKAREALVELARLRSSAPEDLRPGLRKIAHVLFDTFRNDPRLAALRKSIPAEAGDLIPAWMGDDSSGSLHDSGPAARAKALLALAADEQADPLLQEAPSLVRDLMSESRSDLAARILARL